MSASAADLRAPDYAKKGKAIAKEAPAKKDQVLKTKREMEWNNNCWLREEAGRAGRAAVRMATEAEASRNRPPPVPHLRTQAEKMAFLVSTLQGMEKNIQEIMQNQKSLERVVETKFHNMDMKVTVLTTIVRQLQHEVDSMEIPRS
ncbi:hypothetical protein D1007_45145 [Hordeum vulgare]|nr:hypothetical protein D1007_45145 [Hordeum vulgare]